MARDKVMRRLEWAYSFETSKKWLTAIKVDKTGSQYTQELYSKGLSQYCKWLGKTPDQLIEERKEQIKSEDKSVQHEAEEKLREFCAWLEKEKGIKKSTIANHYHSVVKSFYAHHYYPLKLRIPKYVSREIQPHTIEAIKKMLSMIDVRERAIILALKDSGMSREDFVTLKYRDIKEEFEAGKDFIHLKAVRQKEAIEYDTFLGKNAVQQLKAYLELRRQRGEQLTDDSPLFTTERVYGKPITPENLSTIFDRISKTTGIITSPHRLRKFFETHMGLTAPSILVKYWMGHSLGVEKSYFIPPVEKQREKYIEYYGEIDLEEETVSETTLELALGNLLMSLKGKTPSQQREMVTIYLESLTPQTRKTIETKLKTYGIDAILAKDDTKENCRNGNCQKIINESELETYLEKGYRFISSLPSGKILVED